MWVLCVFVILILLFVLVLSMMNNGGGAAGSSSTANTNSMMGDETTNIPRPVPDDANTYIPDPDDPYWLGERDARFKAMQTQYYALCEEIEADYTVLANVASPNAVAYNKVERKCLDAMVLFQMLVPLWEKYDRGIPDSAPPYKRLAMIREKKGDYEGAALACVQQLRLGVQGDGTKGGMRGRLARMVKKGNLAETHPEAMPEISQYLEVK